MKKNKTKSKILFILCCIIGIVLIGVVIYTISIWNSKKIEVVSVDKKRTKETISSSGINKYSVYIDSQTNNDVNLSVKDQYFEDVERLTNIKNIDELYSKMNASFLNENNLNRDNFEDYLVQNKLVGELPAVVSMQYSLQENNVCVYRITYINYMENGKCYRYINFIETKPYEYTVDFSQDEIPTVVNHNYTINQSGLIFEISELYRTSTDIGYKLKVTNNNDYTVQFSFNSINDVELNMQDSGSTKQATTILSSTKYEIPKGSFFVKNLFFPVNMQYHNKILGLTFYNVKLGDIENNLTIHF